MQTVTDHRGSARGSAAPDRVWTPAPVLAMAIRVGAAVAPAVAGLGASVAVRRVGGAPDDVLGVATMWLVVALVGTVVFELVDRAARRLLPLATLCQLSLVFPDQAPARFGVAMRARRDADQRWRSGTVDAHVPESVAAGTLLGLVARLGEHDRRTRGHCERVRAYTDLLAEELGLDREAREKLQWVALVHDIGKLAVPAEVLATSGRLTDEQWDLIRAHPTVGAELAAPLAGWLGEWVRGIAEHHERWDGTGYPAGLSGTDISLAARIISVVDAFDVITAARSYKPAMTPEAARTELAACAGTQFDPRVVRALLNLSLRRLRSVMGPNRWWGALPGSARAGAGAVAATVAVAVALLTGPAVAAPPTQLAGGQGSAVAAAVAEVVDASEAARAVPRPTQTVPAGPVVVAALVAP